MTDTERTISELKSLFADNTTQQISPQDVRDLVESVITTLLTGGFSFIETNGTGIAAGSGAYALTVKTDSTSVLPFQVGGDNGDGGGLREFFSIENNNPGPSDVNFRNVTIKIGDIDPGVQKHGIGPLVFQSTPGQTGDYFQMFQPGSSSTIVARLNQGGTLILNVGGIAGNAIVIQTFGDANPRYKADEFGAMSWGAGGASAVDTTLARSAANLLALGSDDAIKTGAAIHGSLPTASGYAAGSQFYCTTDKQPLWSDGTNWIEADGTNH